MLALVLDDHSEGLKPTEAVIMLSLPYRSLARWAAELRDTGWLAKTCHRWQLILPPMADQPATDGSHMSPVAAADGSQSAPCARGLREDLSSVTSEDPKTVSIIQSESLGESEGGNSVSEPEKLLEKKTPEKKPRGKKRWPVGLDATAAMRQIAQKRGIDFELEFDKLRDHEFANGHTDWEAVGRNWMRKARPERNGFSHSKPPGLVAHEQHQRPPSRRSQAVLDRVEAEVNGLRRESGGGR
jgi:hypothetical protein